MTSVKYVARHQSPFDTDTPSPVHLETAPPSFGSFPFISCCHHHPQGILVSLMSVASTVNPRLFGAIPTMTYFNAKSADHLRFFLSFFLDLTYIFPPPETIPETMGIEETAR